MRPFAVCVLLLTFSANCAVFAGVIGGAELDGGHFGGYSMSDDMHSSDHFGADLAFDGGHSFDNENDIADNSGENFGGDYGGAHGGFDFGGFNDGHENAMSAHEDNAALTAVGLANLLSGGGIGGGHAHMASSRGSSYTISGPTQEIKSIHKISTTSAGGHVIGRTKGASSVEPTKLILVKDESYLGGQGSGTVSAADHSGYASSHGGYAGGHGGYPSSHEGYSGSQGGYSETQGGYQDGHGGYSGGQDGYPGGHIGLESAHAGGHVQLSSGHGGHVQLSSGHGGHVQLVSAHGSHEGHSDLSSGHEGHGGQVELSDSHGGQGEDYGMGNAIAYGSQFENIKSGSGWHRK